MHTASHHRITSLGNFRGALWGMFAGGPIGVATSLNLSLNDPTTVLMVIACFWFAGGFCGHNMQSLLAGSR